MGRVVDILTPDIGDFEAVEVIEIAVRPGDEIQPEDALLTLESDKATMDIPSPAAGAVREVLVQVGSTVSQGTPLLKLEEKEDGDGRDESAAAAARDAPAGAAAAARDAPAGAAPAAPPAARDATADAATPAAPPAARDATADAATPAAPPAGFQLRPAPTTPAGARTVGASASSRAHAGPAVRKFARELGIDLGLVPGSGNKGRILKEDVKAFAKSVMSGDRAFNQPGGALPEMPPVDFSRFGPVEIRPLTRLKRLSGQNLHRNWINIPHVTQTAQADITELEEFRQSRKAEARQQGFNLTLLSFLVKAATTALKKHPEFNSSLAPDGAGLVYKQYFHIGVAVNTDQGLVVPVVKDADKKGLFDLGKELAELADKARNRKLAAADAQGGCFTISSLGHIGGTGFTPIINAPEAAILGVSQAAVMPVFQDGEFQPRLMLPYSLSYDHRIIDGAAAAEFTCTLGEILADIRDILL